MFVRCLEHRPPKITTKLHQALVLNINDWSKMRKLCIQNYQRMGLNYFTKYLTEKFKFFVKQLKFCFLFYDPITCYTTLIMLFIERCVMRSGKECRAIHLENFHVGKAQCGIPFVIYRWSTWKHATNLIKVC